MSLDKLTMKAEYQMPKEWNTIPAMKAGVVTANGTMYTQETMEKHMQARKEIKSGSDVINKALEGGLRRGSFYTMSSFNSQYGSMGFKDDARKRLASYLTRSDVDSWIVTGEMNRAMAKDLLGLDIEDWNLSNPLMAELILKYTGKTLAEVAIPHDGAPVYYLCHMLVELGAKLEDKFVPFEDRVIVDIFPDIQYPSEMALVFDKYPFVHPDVAVECGMEVRVDGKVLHPRHWRWNTRNSEVHFMCYEVIGQNPTHNIDHQKQGRAWAAFDKTERNGHIGATVDYPTSLTTESLRVAPKKILVDPKWMEQYGMLYPEGNDKGTPLTRVAVIGSGNLDRIGRGCMTRHLTNVAIGVLSDIHISYPFATEMEPDDRPETVKGNGRQEIINNGNGKCWPAARTRKGHRRA